MVTPKTLAVKVPMVSALVFSTGGTAFAEDEFGFRCGFCANCAFGQGLGNPPQPQPRRHYPIARKTPSSPTALQSLYRIARQKKLLPGKSYVSSNLRSRSNNWNRIAVNRNSRTQQSLTGIQLLNRQLQSRVQQMNARQRPSSRRYRRRN